MQIILLSMIVNKPLHDFDLLSITMFVRHPLCTLCPCRFNLCGKVTIDKFPEGLSTQVTKRKMIVFPEGRGSAAVSKETSEDGKFCTPVEPGKYIVRVSGAVVVPQNNDSSYFAKNSYWSLRL